MHDLVQVHRLPRDLKNGKGLLLLFYKVIAADFHVKLSEEHSGHLWLTKEELPKLHDSKLKIEPSYCQALETAFNEN